MKAAEPQTFRATTEAWIGQLLLPLFFFVGLVYTAANQGILSPWIGVLLVALINILFAFEYLRPMLRNWLKTDERSIEGSLNGRYFQVYWREILAVRMLPGRRPRTLLIGRRGGTLAIPLRFLDDQTIWEVVQAAVPPAALAEDAIRSLPDRRLWEAAGPSRSAAREGAAVKTPGIVPDHWLVQVIGWCGVTVCLYRAARAWANGDLLVVLVLAVLVGGCFLLLMNWGVTEAGPARLTRYTLFGGRSMLWDDICQIEVDPTTSVLVLSDACQQIVIPGPGPLGRGMRRALLRTILSEAETRGVPVRRTVWALFRVSHRMRREA